MSGMRIPVLLLLTALVSAVDLDRVAAPAGSPVLDLANVLDPGALARCRSACRTAGGDLRVLIVPDCGGQPPREAGLRLFNRWGIGDRRRNDGILLLVAMAERRCEFLLGTGLDDDARVQHSQAIIDRDILPRFRTGDAPGGVVAGIESAARELFPGAVPPTVLSAEDPAQPSPAESPPVAATAPAGRPDPGNDALVLALVLIGGFTVLAGAIGGLVWCLSSPRLCPRCRVPMVTLDEVQDDAHLNPAQRQEERIGSVDYVVWACPSCPQVDIVRHGAWFTRYHTCPACGARTASDRTTVVAPASECSSGLERIDTRCVHCGHQESRNRTLPRIEPHQHHSFGGGGGSSGGGGRSSGRGGGGGW
jgi:uncharacterized protein